MLKEFVASSANKYISESAKFLLWPNTFIDNNPNHDYTGMVFGTFFAYVHCVPYLCCLLQYCYCLSECLLLLLWLLWLVLGSARTSV